MRQQHDESKRKPERLGVSLVVDDRLSNGDRGFDSGGKSETVSSRIENASSGMKRAAELLGSIELLLTLRVSIWT